MRSAAGMKIKSTLHNECKHCSTKNQRPRRHQIQRIMRDVTVAVKAGAVDYVVY